MKLQDSHVFSANFFATAFFGYVDEPYRLLPVGGPDKQVYFDNGGAVPHNSYRYSIINSPQHHANVQASSFFNTGSIGHELKFGFQYRHSVTQSESAWPGDQIFGSDTSSGGSPHCGKNLDSCYAALTRGAATSFQMNYTDAWVSDTFTVDRLTVNAGIRFDYQQGANLPSKVGANPAFPDLLPAVDYAGDQGYPVTYRNWNPRVGVTYALGEKRKSLVRASYARFVDQLRNVVYHVNGLPVISGIYYYWNDTNNDKIVQPGEVDLASGPQGFYHIDPSYAPGTPNQIAPDYKAPTTDELILGFDHELMSDFVVSAAYTYRYITNIQRSPLVGVTANDYVAGGFATGTAVGTNGFMLNFYEPYYKLNTPSAPPGNIYENQPGAYQRYNGVEVQFIKRMSNKWMMRASFGYNDWRQYLTAESIVNKNNLLGGTNDSGGLAVASDSSNPGYDARWQANLTGLYQLAARAQPRRQPLRPRGLLAPLLRAGAGPGRARQLQPLQHPDRPRRRLPDRQRLRIRPAAREDVRDGARFGDVLARPVQRLQQRHGDVAGQPRRRLRLPRLRLHAEPDVQPADAGAEPADRPARRARLLLESREPRARRPARKFRAGLFLSYSPPG